MQIPDERDRQRVHIREEKRKREQMEKRAWNEMIGLWLRVKLIYLEAVESYFFPAKMDILLWNLGTHSFADAAS